MEQLLRRLEHLFALVGLHELLDLLGILVVFTSHHQVHVGGVLVLDEQAVTSRQQVDLGGIGGVDDGQIHIVQGTRQLGCFELDNLDLLRVLDDVQHGTVQTDIRLQLDDALLLQQQQRTAQVGRIVRYGDLRAGLQLVDALDLLGVAGDRIDKGIADGDQLVTTILDLGIQIGLVLEGVDIDAAIVQRDVWRDVIAEADDFNFQTVLLLGDFLGDFNHLSLGSGDGADLDVVVLFTLATP